MSEENQDVNENEEGSSAFETGSITVEKDGHFIHCLTIIGQIEGHFILPSQNKTTKYEHVIPICSLLLKRRLLPLCSAAVIQSVFRLQ